MPTEDEKAVEAVWNFRKEMAKRPKTWLEKLSETPEWKEAVEAYKAEMKKKVHVNRRTRDKFKKDSEAPSE